VEPPPKPNLLPISEPDVLSDVIFPFMIVMLSTCESPELPQPEPIPEPREPTTWISPDRIRIVPTPDDGPKRPKPDPIPVPPSALTDPLTTSRTPQKPFKPEPTPDEFEPPKTVNEPPSNDPSVMFEPNEHSTPEWPSDIEHNVLRESARSVTQLLEITTGADVLTKTCEKMTVSFVELIMSE
jgi:hypothetical protein